MVAIGRAEQELDRIFPEVAKNPGARRKAAPPADAAGKQANDKADKEEARAGEGGDACAVACKALSSMASSADRLCKLAGENDGRCDDARARVRGAMTRVKGSCPACTVTMTAAAPGPASAKGTPPAGPAPGMPGSSTNGIP
jgi:hypothetical protein